MATLPDKIGRYEIKTELGRGGMATVYRAFDPYVRREVALKVLPREFLHDPTFRARFEREAQAIGSLDHPGIVPVYDFGEADGQPYLVMRLMSGGSLADRIKSGPMPVRDIARILGQVGSALDEAHAQGVIHRDLKPGNILFDQRSEPAIADFGIAKLTQTAPSNLSRSLLIGTPAYMSPEQANSDVDIDGRSDIYSLGAILFEMLTGKLPFEADTPIRLVMKHIQEPVPRILDLNPSVPPDCQPVLERAMAKSRDDRFPTAGEMARAFAAAVRSEALSPPHSILDTPALPPKAERLAEASVESQAKRAIAVGAPPASQPTLSVAVGQPPATSKTAIETGERRPARSPRGSGIPQIGWMAAIASVILLIAALGLSQLTTSAPTPTPTVTLTLTPTPTRTPTETPTPSPTTTPPPGIPDAIVNTSASVYAGPSVNCKELDIVNVGESVEVLGRSDGSGWLYVRTDNGNEGFVARSRFDWEGDFESLPITPGAACAAPTPTPTATLVDQRVPRIVFFQTVSNGHCDPVPGYTLQIQGEDAPGPFQYYVNDQLVATSNDAYFYTYTFPNQASIVVTGRVVAANGKSSREIELFLRRPNC
jgi:serine/threonine-protein kinase